MASNDSESQPIRALQENLNMKFSTLIVVFVSVAISGIAATLVAVERDVADLTTVVKTLNTLVRTFPATGGTIPQALTLRSAALNVSAVFEKATADLSSTPPLNDANGARLHSKIKAPTELLILTLNVIVVKKSAFDKILIGTTPISVAVLATLKTLGASGAKFGARAMALYPASVKPDALALKSKTEAAFNKAVAAYSK